MTLRVAIPIPFDGGTLGLPQPAIALSRTVDG